MSQESDLGEGVSVKENCAQKERDFRAEIRNLKAVSRRLVVACAD